MNTTAPTISAILTERLEVISGYRSQQEVAQIAGFDNTNVFKIIAAGKTKLSLDRIRGVAQALDMPVEDLLEPALRQYFSDDVIDLMRNHLK